MWLVDVWGVQLLIFNKEMLIILIDKVRFSMNKYAWNESRMRNKVHLFFMHCYLNTLARKS